MKVKWLPIALVLAFVMSGCGKASESVDATKATEQQIKITDAAGRELTFHSHPKTFASLTIGDMDMIDQLGGEIVGRPSTKLNLPNDLLDIEEIGNTHQPNIEKIIGIKPDVLIANVGFDRHIPVLEKHGIQTIMTETNSIADLIKNMETFGILLGKEEKAQELINQMKQAVKKQPDGPNTRALLIYGAPGSFFAALPTSLAGDILEKAGGVNVATDFPKIKEYPQYAQLAAERVLTADPDVIYLITHGDPSGVEEAFKHEMEKHSAWKNLDAVKEGKVVVLPPEWFGSNPGTKIIEALEFMRESLQEAGMDS
ncbi:ABC transporter substrate-binding protein [Caldifermentibacillus hisashii]|uniref:ABC transporter substrate-binding protein n=1 Tax=Caldifermentibacillus hisashii TaxID=996558 RepID=UPI0031B6F7AF